MTQPPLELEPQAPQPAAGPGSLKGGEEHRAARTRRLRAAILTSLIARPLSLATSVVSLPLFVKYLGAERYGLYEAIGALTAWLFLTNAGLGMGLQNHLQDCHVSGNRELARGYVTSLALAMAALAAIAIVAVTITVPLIDWHAVFRTSTPEAGRGMALSVWIAAVITLLGIANCIPYVAYAAFQEMHRINVWEGVGRLATLAACVCVIWTDWGLVGVILASSGVALLVRLANTAWFFLVEHRWLVPAPRYFQWSLLRLSIRDGVYLFLLQTATALIFHTDKLIIGIRLDAASVSGYAVVGRIFIIAYGAFMLVQMPLWPAYGDAIRRGDYAWARRMIFRMVATGVASMLAVGMILLVFRDRILPLVTRDRAIETPPALILAVCAFFVMRAWAECQSIPLNAAGVVRPQLVFLLGNGLLNVALAFALARPFGVLGVAWAFPITSAFTTLWGYPWLVRRYLFANHPAAAEKTA